MSNYGKLFQILELKKKCVSPDMKVDMLPYLYASKNGTERARGVGIIYMSTTTDIREGQKLTNADKACIVYKFNERHVIITGQPPR